MTEHLSLVEPVKPTATILHGDCIDVMRTLPDASVDSIVTDPPYGLGFMGKAWDDLPPGEDWARECLRVLKPGGHLLAFGGTRTWHRLAVAVEDAGFEIRDSIAWMYGSGFPKSLDVSKAIDKAAGAKREVVGEGRWASVRGVSRAASQGASNGGTQGGYNMQAAPAETAPATAEAKAWEGWGTALKPAFEPCVVARKPLAEKTVAGNVLAYGTGALNIDASRIGTETRTNAPAGNGTAEAPSVTTGASNGGTQGGYNFAPDAPANVVQGRWPANVILDEHTAPLIDEQSGVSKSKVATFKGSFTGETYGKGTDGWSTEGGHNDSGGASRFFYVAKAPKRERPVITHEDGTRTAHPTVKPLTLMRHLVTLVTPPGGTVLEPFAGSGATVEAALLEGFDVVAIEREADYLPLIRQRIARVQGVWFPNTTDSALGYGEANRAI